MGRYHGKHTFDQLSHQRACLIRSLGMENVNLVPVPSPGPPAGPQGADGPQGPSDRHVQEDLHLGRHRHRHRLRPVHRPDGHPAHRRRPQLAPAAGEHQPCCSEVWGEQGPGGGEPGLLGRGTLIKPEEITLGGCSATEVDNWAHVLAFESELHGCGSTLVMTENSFIYAFALVYNPKVSGRSPIMRRQSAVIGVECHYPRWAESWTDLQKPT
ncbi:hypothetical protein KUCAC02_006075 [Chaenocephalus aceratus]|uniref:Uncharacterized protein n=1 Tax=Chaenocephalus aceratus TaxID=36190 RepID=A0ACB9WQ64_CHAAC|nr:hypothetical protein KUCAC02_006075 [Chaenocephalus aceratus]